MSSISVSSTISSYGPSTPLHPHHDDDIPNTPSLEGAPPSTPPFESLSMKKYKAAMVAQTTASWARALKGLKDPEPGVHYKRRSDPAQLAFDEDPFDRHAREWMSPGGGGYTPVGSSTGTGAGTGIQRLSLDEASGVRRDSDVSMSGDDGASPMEVSLGLAIGQIPDSPTPAATTPYTTDRLRPIEVRIPGESSFSESSSSSLSYSNFASSSTDIHDTIKQPYNFPKRPLLRTQTMSFTSSNGTPGSYSTDESFEAVSGDDYFRMYGRGVNQTQNQNQNQQITNIPGGSASTSQLSPSSFEYSYPLSPHPHPSLNRSSTISTSTTTSSIFSSESIGSIASAQTAIPSRPKLAGRPRPRDIAHPYASVPIGQPIGNAGGTGVGEGRWDHEPTQEEDWSGRTPSENLLVTMGRECQRGRRARMERRQ